MAEKVQRVWPVRMRHAMAARLRRVFICPSTGVDRRASRVILRDMDQNVSPLPADVDHLTGPTLARLMRANGQTLRALARAMDVAQRRVREVRAHGVQGRHLVWDWAEAIAGDPRLSWSDVARLYLGAAARSMPSTRSAERGRPLGSPLGSNSSRIERSP